MPPRPDRRAPAPSPSAVARSRRAQRLGRVGERLAAEHLRRLGFRLLASNVRSRDGEIDLIAFDGRTLVFVEVKTRCATARAVPPLERLERRQRARVRRLATAWLCASGAKRPHASELRLDAIGVVVDRTGRLLALDHVEGAW
jgi:putative endonuclease